MRIALVAPPWAPIPPELYGGIEGAIDNLARGLQSQGHDVLLFTTGDSTCPVPRRWLLPNAEGNRMGFTVPELRHVMAAYDAVAGYDIVHDHTVIGPVYSEILPAVKVVTTIHGPFNEELTDIYRRLGERVPIIGISEAQRRPVPDIPIARVIHHAVDAEAFPVGSGGDYVVYLGRMAPEKGAHRAVVAARKADVPIKLAGKLREPWEHLFFEKEVSPLLGDDVEYVGEVTQEEKVKLLAGARATLFPIRWNEPFGLVMLESLACGTPVIAYPEGAAPEVVEDGRIGYLVRSETDMAEAIERVRHIDRGECRAAVETRFSIERLVREHVELYEEVLSV
ncbi:MAG TPA: glycosyltransferase family 4 protein [Acidimicrobiales bacterium]|nr:glycosyltransferase family 4 protein [Acidimicrobiales bacterium]